VHGVFTFSASAQRARSHFRRVLHDESGHSSRLVRQPVLQKLNFSTSVLPTTRPMTSRFRGFECTANWRNQASLHSLMALLGYCGNRDPQSNRERLEIVQF
jgi:hypothetical protein